MQVIYSWEFLFAPALCLSVSPTLEKWRGTCPSWIYGSGASDRLVSCRQWIREMYYYELNAHSAASVLEVAKLSSHAAISLRESSNNFCQSAQNSEMFLWTCQTNAGQLYLLTTWQIFRIILRSIF